MSTFPIGVSNPGGAYDGHNLVGYHIGAALSYQAVATSTIAAAQFLINDTAHQLQDTSIAQGYNLPCYIVVDGTQISMNSGPLECGAGDKPAYKNHAYSGTHVLGIDGVTGWYICTVNSFTYGWVENVVVGSYGGDTPSGPGIQGGSCTDIQDLVFGGATPGSGTSSSAPMSMTSAPPYPTIDPGANTTVWSTTVITKPCPVCEETTYVTTCTGEPTPTPAWSNSSWTSTVTTKMCHTCPDTTYVTTCSGQTPAATTRPAWSGNATMPSATHAPSPETFPGAASPGKTLSILLVGVAFVAVFL